MTDNGRRYYLSPSLLSKTKYDPTEVEREQKRKRVEAIPQETRWTLDERLSRRMGPMRKVKT